MLNWLRTILLPTQDEYWNSIKELPLYNWIKCNNGLLEFTRVNKRGNKIKDLECWENLYNEYLSEFGLDDRYKKYLQAKKKKAIIQAEYILKNDNGKLTEIEIQNQRIKDLEMYFGTGQKIEIVLTWLGKFLGYKVDPKNTTVMEYFTILEEYGKANKT